MPLHRTTMWNASFLSMGCSILSDNAMLKSLEMRARLTVNQRVLKKLHVHSNSL